MMPSPSGKGSGSDVGKEEVEKKGTRTRLRHIFKRHSHRETKESLETNVVSSTDRSNLESRRNDNSLSSQTDDIPTPATSHEPALQPSPPIPDASSKLSSNMEPSILWSRAYDNLKHENGEMVTEYELLLSKTGEPGQDINTIAQSDADERKAQMDEIMRAGKKHYDEKAIKYKLFGTEHALEDDIASAVNVVLWGKDWIGEAVKASPEASLAWAGVSAILPFLTNASKARSEHTTAFESILSKMDWYVEYERLLLLAFKDSRTEKLRPNFEKLIQKFYEDILSFQIRSVLRFYKSRKDRLARDTLGLDKWLSMSDDIKTSDEAIQKEADQIRKILQLEEVKEINKNTREVASLTAKLVKRQMDADEAKILQCFRLVVEAKDEKGKDTDTGGGYEAYKDINGEISEGTGKWCFDNQHFKNWMRSSSGPFLITSDPGCGKSMVAKHLVDKVLPPQNRVLCYFFFKDAVQSKLNQMLCAVLHQIFLQRPNLIARCAAAQYGANGKKLAEITEALWSILSNTIDDEECDAVTIVVDAVDECETAGRDKLAAYLTDYFTKRSEDGQKLKIVLTARPYGQVLSRFSNLESQFPEMLLAVKDGDLLTEEIDAVIKARVEQLERDKGLSPGRLDYLKIRLLENKHRTYLWLKLVFDHFRNPTLKLTDKAFQKDIIDSVPSDFDDAYERILRRSENRDAALKVLEIVLAARFPLTTKDLQMACEFEWSTPTSLSDLDLEDTDEFKERVRNQCGLFLTFSNDRAFLLHQTAREFLLTSRSAEVSQGSVDTNKTETGFAHSLRETHTHFVMAQVCMRYIGLSGWSDKSNLANIGVTYDYHAPLLSYASINWAYHVRSASPDFFEQLKESALSLCLQKGYYPWLQFVGPLHLGHFSHHTIGGTCGTCIPWFR